MSRRFDDGAVSVEMNEHGTSHAEGLLGRGIISKIQALPRVKTTDVADKAR